MENIIQRAIILATEPVIHTQNLPINIFQIEHYKLTSTILPEARRLAIEKAEKEIIATCLKCTSGHISKATKLAGVDVSNFHKLIKRYGIDSNQFK